MGSDKGTGKVDLIMTLFLSFALTIIFLALGVSLYIFGLMKFRTMQDFYDAIFGILSTIGGFLMIVIAFIALFCFAL